MLRAIAFDSDNTLYSTKAAAKPADIAAMEALSAATGKRTDKLYAEFAEIVKTVKDSPDPKVRHRLHSYGLLSGRYGKKVANEMYEALSKKLMELIILVPGIEKVLKMSEKMGLKIFVVTEDNRDMAIKKLSTLGIAGYFETIISSDDTGVMKPSKKYYEALLKEFKPEEILVVGDNLKKDLNIPDSLGMRTVLVEKPEDLAKIEEFIK